MNGTPGRAAGIGLGLLIFIIGFTLLDADTVAHQTPARIALASVLVALGIGAIGAALMPNTLTINGKDVTPLGLSGTATGGAAFFVATLVFLYATGVNKPDHDAGPGPGPVPSPTQSSAAPSPDPTPDPLPTASPRQTDAPAPPPAPRTSVPPDGDDVDDPPQGNTAANTGGQQAMARAYTYCSTCCPQGPQNCQFSGYGMAPTYQQAAEIAVRYCMASGGRPDNCFANVRQY